jgi:hypothetical protein
MSSNGLGSIVKTLVVTAQPQNFFWLKLFPAKAGIICPGKGETMNFALAIAFALVVAAPFIGRWRANVWLKANVPSVETTTAGVAETV